MTDYEITALDMNYLIKELKMLVGAKVDKIYHPEKKELLVQFYLSGKGKFILRCVVEIRPHPVA